MLTKEAFNALLKTLEEPPSHSIFIFATTEIHKVPQTIISRCQRFDFGFGSKEMILASVNDIASKEGLKISDEVAELVYRVSGGSFRDAQSLLDQLSSHMTGKDFSIEDATKILHLAEFAEINDFIEILKLNNASQSIQFLGSMRDKGIDFEQFNHHLILRLRSMAIEKILEDQDGLWEVEAIKKFTEALQMSKISPIDVLPLEIACIELAKKPTEVVLQVSATQASPDAKDSKVKDLEPAKAQASKHKVLSSEAKIAIIESVGAKNKPLASLLGSAVWVQDDKNIIIRVEYPFHKDTIMNKNNLNFIATCVDSMLEGPVKIECHVCKEGEMDEDISDVFDLAK
jgi:DNA polymerase III gamma/tau subunit